MFLLRHSCKLALWENSFPRIKSASDDKAFTQALLKRNGDPPPTAGEKTALLNLVTKIDNLDIWNNLVVAPGKFDAFQLDEL
ncbi:unnamed protein product [Diabrotica balteata]|uniref:DZF domain-containing protein n=1 Tax=Diabrotica balteata TaxID=107213 RepID=A0A9N9X7B9_DIABA|nr:unnamed protein product [Diabrotica balteata]